MKKFTLLIAMLVCAVSFGQNFSDLPVEEVNKAKQAKIDQAARTAKAVSSAFASAATMGENNPTYINQLTQEQKAAFNEEVSKLSVLSPGNNPVFANRLSQEQLASFDEEVSNLKANSSESNPTYANQLTAEQAANFNQSPSNLGVIANVSSNPIFTGNQKVISPNTTDSSFVPCNGENASNAFENGRGCSVNNNWTAANDLIVTAGNDAMLTSIVPNIFMSVGASATAVDVTIYEDAAGLPGTMVAQELGLVPSSSVVVGSNFGLDISAVTLDLTPVALAGDAAMDTNYWVAIQVTTSDGANAFWEDSTATAVGADLAFNDGTGWIIPGPGQDGVYTFVVDCTPMGGGVACDESNPSNAFENGRGCSVNNNWTAANDFTLLAGSDGMLTSIVPNIFMSVGATATTVDVTIYDDAGGLPGTMIDQQLAVVPTSQVVVGSNFGLDISAVTMDLTPVALAGDAAMDTQYWVAIQVTTSDGANAFWEDSTASAIGADLAFNDGTGWTIPAPGQDGVYTYVVDCTPMGGGVACDESNPSNAFENGRGCSANNNWTVANDFTLLAGSDG
ncbi:MAG: hypothetical protein K0U54_03940, partial [Bacteroidetes bacterium]|nr:hypothetical protein [Bacteroidota bacterium]